MGRCVSRVLINRWAHVARLGAVLLNPAVRQPHYHAIEQTSRRWRRGRRDAEGAVVLFARRALTLSLAAAATGTCSPASHDFSGTAGRVTKLPRVADNALELYTSHNSSSRPFWLLSSVLLFLAKRAAAKPGTASRASQGVCEERQQSL